MADHRDPNLDSWDAHRAEYQDILNEKPIPAHRLQRRGRLPITARIVWARDGEEHIDTLTDGWTETLVLVEILDHRRRIHGVWLDPDDVERR